MEKSVAAKVSNHIYDDVAFVILSKLPLKSLFRFCCVRKSWSVLFQNRYFMDMFRRNLFSMDHSYYNDTSILLHHNTPDRSTLDTFYSLFGERFENKVKSDYPNPFDPITFYLYTSGTVNGIVCMVGVTSTNDLRTVLWNPATCEFKAIPPSPFDIESPYWHSLTEVFGFGYDQVRDDYKVIRGIYFFDDDWETSDDERRPDDVWEIYCLKSNKWRKLDFNLPMQMTYSSKVGVQLYADGVCHWWGNKGDPESEISDDKEYLVSFDLNNETFVKTPIPTNMDFLVSTTVHVFRHLNLLNGSIVLISNYQETSTFHISILGEVGIKESWIKLCIVGPLPGFFKPIGIGKKGDIFFRKKNDELVWFNLNTQKIEELGLMGGHSCGIMIYKENFLPFESIND